MKEAIGIEIGLGGSAGKGMLEILKLISPERFEKARAQAAEQIKADLDEEVQKDGYAILTVGAHHELIGLDAVAESFKGKYIVQDGHTVDDEVKGIFIIDGQRGIDAALAGVANALEGFEKKAQYARDTQEILSRIAVPQA